jgi:hypothetical protein
MANITLTGVARWAKVHKPDAKYGYFGLELLPDETSLKKIQESGVTTIKPSKDGEGYYSFKRRPSQVIWKDKKQQAAGAPAVVDAEGDASRELIGNGSKVRIYVETYPYDNTFGKGVGCRLEVVQILELVRFEDKTDDKPQLRIMF